MIMMVWYPEVQLSHIISVILEVVCYNKIENSWVHLVILVS